MDTLETVLVAPKDSQLANPNALDQAITVRLITGRELRGRVFIPKGKRLQDVLNDERAFLPVQTIAGQIHLMNKTSIVEIHEDAAAQTNSPKRDHRNQAILELAAVS